MKNRSLLIKVYTRPQWKIYSICPLEHDSILHLHAVNSQARFCSNPTKEHWTAVKRIFRYLRETTEFGLLYSKGESSNAVGYADPDWAGDCNDYKSTTDYMFKIGGTAATWKSKKQSCVALSTAETEYMALASTACSRSSVDEGTHKKGRFLNTHNFFKYTHTQKRQ